MILESLRSKDVIFIDWWLMNHCNYNCSYCDDIIKNGSADLPKIQDCLDFVNVVTEYSKKNNKKLEFSITGGELTQWPFLPDLLSRIKENGMQSTIRSNASSGVDDWNRILDSVHCVRLEFHPEFQNLAHFAMIVSSTMKRQVSCSVHFNMIPDRWEEIESAINKLIEFYPDLSISKKMLFSDPLTKTQPLNYSPPQLAQFENQNGDLIYYVDGEPVRTDFQTLMIHQKNTFVGNKCNIGLEQFIVDVWGRVYRGHCRQGGKIGMVGKDFIFPTQPITCNKPSCVNGFDIVATKFS